MTDRRRRFEREALPHLDAAYNLARWLTRSPPEAEDVLQEALLLAYRGFDGLRGGEPRPWLLAIVRNSSMTWLKRHRNITAWEEFDDSMEDPRSPQDDPESALLASCDRQQVHKAMEELPVEFREAIILRELEGLSYKEVAIITAVPLGTVMSRLARGRDCLRRLLAAYSKESLR